VSNIAVKAIELVIKTTRTKMIDKSFIVQVNGYHASKLETQLPKKKKESIFINIIDKKISRYHKLSN
jgi:hypothetical protein